MKRVLFVMTVLLSSFQMMAQSFLDEDSGMWVADSGVYRCMLGASSADIRLSKEFAVYSRISFPVHPQVK